MVFVSWVYVLQELFADAILVVVSSRKEGLELVVDFEDLHLSFVLVREIGFGDGVAGEGDGAERHLDVEGNGSQIQHVLQFTRLYSVELLQVRLVVEAREQLTLVLEAVQPHWEFTAAVHARHLISDLLHNIGLLSFVVKDSQSEGSEDRVHRVLL